MGTSLRVANLAVREVAKNFLMGFEPVRKIRLRGRRTAMTAPSPESIFLYAFRLPSICVKYADGVQGKDILEIGPGDHLSNGLTLLALGAKSFTALDRFPGSYSSPTAKAWYRLTREHFAATFAKAWPDLDPETFPESCPAVRSVGTPIEGAPALEADIVCSHNVAEHVSDVKAFAEANRRMLRKGGVAVHVVDFGGHNWHLDAQDPLLFRRLPSSLWNAMGSNRGYPNRVPFAQFTAILREAGLGVEPKDLKPFEFLDEVQEATYVCR